MKGKPRSAHRPICWNESVVFFLTCLLAGSCASIPHRHSAAETGSRKIASLDNNAATSIDPSLETARPDEEAEFAKVATLIGEFVKHQKEILARNLPKYEALRQSGDDSNDKAREYRSVYSDLKFGKGNGVYATRDVHRKTNGCFMGSLRFDDDLRQRLNRQIREFREARHCDGPASEIQGPGACPQEITTASELGVFQPGQNYDAVVRFSNGNPKNQYDRNPDARGMAVKILPTGFLKFPLEDNDAISINKATLLDILGINFPTFFTSDPMKYWKVNQYFFKSAENFNSFSKQKFYEALSVFGSGFSVMERQLGLAVNGSIIASPLFQTYHSMVPSRLGLPGSARAVKYRWTPVPCDNSQEAIEEFAREQAEYEAPWTQYRLYSSPTPESFLLMKETPPFEQNFDRDYLRKVAFAYLKNQSFCYDLRVQLYRDQASTNIEDAEDFWPASELEKKWWEKDIVPGRAIWLVSGENRSAYLSAFEKKALSPAITIAHLTLRQFPENYDGHPGNNKTCEDMSFNPWNGRISYHKPLGIISRLKRRAYDESRRTRHELNGIDSRSQERTEGSSE